jgi:cytochrome c oxidase subunit 2
MILIGGVVLPIAVLSGFLIYGFAVLQTGGGRSSLSKDAVTIIGHRWWWQVVYRRADGHEVVSANELRIPVGQRVSLSLESADVIHSFWAPRLAGKLDMIPGRTNVLTLQASAPGISRGQCAEYCGGAHALMSFYVIAMPPDDFNAWLRNEAATAQEPAGDAKRTGRDLFQRTGCGACHTVRGTSAVGTIGPDLTHVGGRMSLGAGTLPNDADAFARWIENNQHIKPENLMPPFGQLSPPELRDLSLYLESLQ